MTFIANACLTKQSDLDIINLHSFKDAQMGGCLRMRRMLSFQLSRMVRCGGHGQLLLPFPVEDWYHILRWMATGPVPTPSGQTIPPLPPRRKLPGPGIRLPRKFFRPMGSIQIKCSASGSHGSRMLAAGSLSAGTITVGYIGGNPGAFLFKT